LTTAKQDLGEFGESVVRRSCACPKCKRPKTLKALVKNFKCADLICDFCGFLAQVKAKTVKDVESLPSTILGAAWRPQKERMAAGIYFPLFIVLVSGKKFAIYYLPADLQRPELFVARKPLSENAKRAGWQGFYYDLTKLYDGSLVRLV